MLRRLRVWSCTRTPSLVSNIRRTSQSISSRQQLFSSRPNIPRPRPRNSRHNNGSGHNGHNGSYQLQSSIYASVYTTIGFIVANETLDMADRQEIGLRFVESIVLDPDETRRYQTFFAQGRELLGGFSGTEATDHVFHTSETGWNPAELDVRLHSTPDPEVEGGRLFFCLASIKDLEASQLYIDELDIPSQLRDAAYAIFPVIGTFIEGLPNSPRVRGALCILQDKQWISLYWDGKRWINFVFLEWQTAESMGLPSITDFIPRDED
ncbi:hypothetical protein F5Y18DRAFT_339049 [Xylariaceae sp. FL1019]|nr:hypothetical protein F5Y18DRAFT_339049 [Xylariaceae sp. FL1019]